PALVLTVGSRLTDFATASQSLFKHPEVRFASINVDGHDAARLGATPIIGAGRLALAALTEAAKEAGVASPEAWRDEVRAQTGAWAPARAAALDPDTPFPPSRVQGDVVPDTGAELTQGQLIGLLQEHAQPGDTIIAAAGGPPGDLQKVWADTRCPPLPPGVRLPLHGLRAAGGHRGPPGRARPGPPGALLPRRRHLPDGPDRAGHGRPGGAGGNGRDPREPRLPGHPPPPDAAQRARVRQRVPLPQGRPRPGRRRHPVAARGRLPQGRPGPGGRRARGPGAPGPGGAGAPAP